MSEGHERRYGNPDACGDMTLFAILFAVFAWVAYGLYLLFNPEPTNRRR